MVQTIQQLLVTATTSLHPYTTTPRLDAEVLLAFTLACSRTILLSKLDEIISNDKKSIFQNFIKRRIAHEPVAYITNEKEFFQIPFYVSPSVLIPRPETETLVQYALEFLKYFSKTSTPLICDIGTGSGCIMTSIATNIHNESEFTGIDISSAALAIAEKNFSTHTQKKASFILSNLFQSIDDNIQYDCITANLPYVSEYLYNNSTTYDIHYEPKIALTAANNGCSLLFNLIESLPEKLTDHGAAFLEFSPEQYGYLENYRDTNSLPLSYSPFPDEQNIIRFCKIEKQ